MFSGTQTEILHFKSESQFDAVKRLDAIIPSNTYIILNLMEMSGRTGTDSDED